MQIVSLTLAMEQTVRNKAIYRFVLKLVKLTRFCADAAEGNDEAKVDVEVGGVNPKGTDRTESEAWTRET